MSTILFLFDFFISYLFIFIFKSCFFYRIIHPVVFKWVSTAVTCEPAERNGRQKDRAYWQHSSFSRSIVFTLRTWSAVHRVGPIAMLVTSIGFVCTFCRLICAKRCDTFCSVQHTDVVVVAHRLCIRSSLKDCVSMLSSLFIKFPVRWKETQQQ